MKSTSEAIGSFRAKTHFSSLLDAVQKGAEYIITLRGKPVARLTAFIDENDDMDMHAILAEFKTIRRRVKGKGAIKELISAGRKH